MEMLLTLLKVLGILTIGTLVGVYFLVRFLRPRARPENKKPLPKTENRLKLAPLLIEPIVTDDSSYQLTPYANPIPALPETKGGWGNIDEDKEILTEYAKQLDLCTLNVTSAARRAIGNFEADYAQLNHQQLQIYRRIYQSQSLLAPFPELKQHAISAEDIPDTYRVRIPSRPVYLRAEEIQKKYYLNPDSVSKGIGNASGKLMRGKGISQNLLVAVGAIAVNAAILAVNAKSGNSKVKRALEAARGSIGNYSTSVMTTIDILGKAHVELVTVSQKLKKSEVELIEMIERVSRIEPDMATLDQLPPHIRKDVGILYFLMLEAEVYSKNRL